jgi:hypothetical protein
MVALSERNILVPPDVIVSPALPEVVFDRDYPSLWAKRIGEHSGVPFTEQRQLDLFREFRLREGNPDSDQFVYLRVLEQTSGCVEVYKAAESVALKPYLLAV